jgi:uncharacterized protein YjbI with pentapeptide repeats
VRHVRLRFADLFARAGQHLRAACRSASKRDWRPIGRGIAVAASLAVFILLTLSLVAPRSFPSAKEIKAASTLGSAQKFCDDQRAQLGNLPPLPAEEALRRIKAGSKQSATQVLDLRFARLEKQDLTKMVLENADLRFARLNGTTLEATNLAGADLTCADLTFARGKASFRGANVKGAILVEADLQSSSFADTDLTLADLTRALLKEANFTSATLTGTLLVGTDFDKANMTKTDFKFADYRAAGAPRLIGARNLAWLQPGEKDFAGLSALRKSLLESGDDTQARTVTYVIETWRDAFDAQSAWHPMVWLRGFAFDHTVAYGRKPARAGILLLWLWLAFALGYFFLLCTSANQGAQGLFEVIPKGSVVNAAAGLTEASETQIARVQGTPSTKWLIALWFSALSATRFGYGSFTLSSWLAGMQPGQKEYRAVGPVRTLSGIHALASLFLLVLFAITLFGDPFSLWP